MPPRPLDYFMPAERSQNYMGTVFHYFVLMCLTHSYKPSISVGKFLYFLIRPFWTGLFPSIVPKKPNIQAFIFHSAH